MRLDVSEDITAVYDVAIDLRQFLLDAIDIVRREPMLLDHLAPERASGSNVFSDVTFGIQQVHRQRLDLRRGYRRDLFDRFGVRPLGTVALPVLEKAAFQDIFALDCVPSERRANRCHIAFVIILNHSETPKLEPWAALGKTVGGLSPGVGWAYQNVNNRGPVLRCGDFALAEEYVVAGNDSLTRADRHKKRVEKATLPRIVLPDKNRQPFQLDVNAA